MVNQNSIFGGMLTTQGAAKKTNCDALGIPWEPRYMLIGDANGTDPVPSPAQTKLVNQVYRAQLNQLRVSPTDANILIAELVLPPDVGGWWIRELALEDKDGVFSAVANVAPSYKPLLAQGSGRNQVVRMHIITSGTSNIELKIDPSVVLATREYVDTSILAALNRQDFKHSVLVATTAAIALNGLQTIDGVAVPAGARVLVKNQVAGKDNGIYTAAAGAWSRVADADESIEVTPGLFVQVERGTTQADSVCQLVTDAPITLGETALVFEVIAGPSGVVPGSYMKITVDKLGRVVSGTNPTTLAGFGIVDAVRNKTDGTVDSTTDWNTIIAAGRHPKIMMGDTQNGPGVVGSVFYAEVLYHSALAFTQLAYPYATAWEGAGSIYFRSHYNGAWYPWRTIQHSGHYALKTEAEVGTASKLLMSPLAVYQAIASHAPPGFISGLSLAVNAVTPNTDIDIEVGRARDSTDTVDLILAAGLTKRFQAAGAWSAGAGGNALFPGAKVANTFYHFFLIRKDSDGSVDVGFDTSLIAANRPAGYGKFVRLKGRAVKTDGSGNIIPFINTGNSTDFKTMQRDLYVPGVATNSYSLTVSVPPGVRVRSRFYARIQGESSVIYVRSPEAAAVTLSNTSTDSFVGGIGMSNDATSNENVSGYCEALTNQSGQVVVQVYIYPGYSGGYASLHTQGWTEE